MGCTTNICNVCCEYDSSLHDNNKFIPQCLICKLGQGPEGTSGNTDMPKKKWRKTKHQNKNEDFSFETLKWSGIFFIVKQFICMMTKIASQIASKICVTNKSVSLNKRCTHFLSVHSYKCYKISITVCLLAYRKYKLQSCAP